MKRYLLLPILSFTTIALGKSIQDPVARHDAKECGTYLCPSIPTYATAYLQSGCYGEFQEYIRQNHILKGEVQIKEKTDGSDKNIIILLSGMSGVISFLVGYLYGKKEREEREFDLYEMGF
jgi:hypothetical protein